jgi:dihydroorotate dehydrogenase (NAD+) catalytic subunit
MIVAAPTPAATIAGSDLCGLPLAHPIINASGTFDLLAAERAFGASLFTPFPFAAFVSKTITLRPRPGNPPPRLWETAAGMINSIGLPNKGLKGYMEEDLPALARALGGGEPGAVPLITNVMGSDGDELAALVGALDERPEVAALELNVSCPNVDTGLDLGADPRQLARALALVRPATAKPLIVKLTPNTADVAGVAAAAEAAGADAVSLINTLRATAMAPDRRGSWLGGGGGGLSGPAIRSVALAQVAAVAERVAIPVVGIGGVQSARHALDLLDVGAHAVAVGTESFRDPAAGVRIARELQAFLAKSGFEHSRNGSHVERKGEKSLQSPTKTINQPGDS